MGTDGTTAGVVAETPMDQVVHLACNLLGAKMGLVSILGDVDLSFRAMIGLDRSHVPADVSVTRKLVEMGPGAVLDVPDALADPRFAHHPMVAGPPHLRSYAGATVSTAEGVAIGSIAVMGMKPRRPIAASKSAALVRLARIAGNIYDQTTARRGEREQLEKLELAEAMSGVGHWRFEPATGKLDWSAEAHRIHGLPPGEAPLTMQEAAHLYHADDRTLIQRLLVEGVRSGETYRLRIIRPDGAVRVAQASARCERDETGAAHTVFGVIQDITERELERVSLSKSEADYRLLADNLGDIVARLRLTGRIDYVSPACFPVLGWTPEEMTGQSFKAFVNGEIWQAFRGLIARRARGDTSHRLQHQVVRKNGTLIWVETDCQVVKTTAAGLPELVLTVRDISERKRLQDETLAARERAEAADRAKSEFLANMSHELRTPLTSVIGFSGVLLNSTDLTAPDRSHVRRIATASDVLLGVINDILDYSKLEAEAVELEVAAFDPRALAEDAASIVEGQCEGRGLGLALDLPADECLRLCGDVTKLRQVMLNFLSNAVKFTPRGEVRLAIDVRPQGSGLHTLRVAVSDTGVGIAPEKLELVFERFTQADASTTRVYGGTGLGLSISRRLIELMNGSIGAEARLGGGTTFWFEVSLREAAQEEAAIALPLASLPSGLHVLVADDAAPNRELVTVLLEAMGVQVAVAKDGAEAVLAVRATRFDLVLMDVHMPVMDGLAATRAIRLLGDAFAGLPIIALTANIEPDQVRRCREAGMDDVVGKPIRIVELVHAMSGVLASRSGQGARSSAA